ncbi:MAG: hypothetical protein DME26_07615 [Verrucomicrobia bacterium]|nr:MAG: hypothetical protein DME26_07615 [Verrucomicrobiota bacterium]
MKRQSKLTSQEQPQLSEVKSQQTSAREFGSVEELLRYDAKQTIVRPAVAERLQKSINETPKSARLWWQRFFGTHNP